MKKYLFLILTTLSVNYAGMINAIAIIVNDTPITLYEIDKTVVDKKISKQNAIAILIDKILYDQELKKHNIAIDIFDIEHAIERIASQNKMNLIDFKSAIRQQQDYDKFTKDIKQQLLHQKLIKAIAKNQLKIATDDDMKIFYDAHIEEYKIANTIDAIEYSSKNKSALLKQKKNLLKKVDTIETKNTTLTQSNLSPEIKYLINSTKQNNFTSIFVKNQKYTMFFINIKKDITTVSFENSKDRIFQFIMKQRENNYLKEYFETLKLTADIKILR